MFSASSSQRSAFGSSAAGLTIVLIAAAAVGCKSGSSWTAKPSWWTLGGSGEDPAKLASAPPASADLTKPSAAAKPYPTTTTPEGYVLENAQRAGGSQVAATTPAPAVAATEPAAITYGTKPAAPAAPLAASPPVASSTAGGLAGIAPQVGPYGAPPGAAPIEQTLPPASTGFGEPAAPAAMAAAAPAAFGAPPAANPVDPVGVRVADARGSDARGSDAWAAAPAAAPAAGDSRYGSATGSRFSGGAMPSAVPAAAAAPFSAPPAAAPLTPAIDPLAVPAATPAMAPAAAPSSLAPPTPTRRPDPGYRPGGTSSYRPNRTILAGDAGGEPEGVQPVSFEMPAAAGGP